jgi:hypothetical protein
LQKRLEGLGKHWRVIAALAIVELTVLLFVFAWISSGSVSGQYSDYQALWVAGKSLLAGTDPVDLYSPDYFQQLVEQWLRPGSKLLWLYPPSFLPVAAATTWLPFAWSYYAWGILCLCMVYLALRLLNTPWKTALFLTAFPAALLSAAMGQVSALFLLLVVTGLVLLDRKPVWVGVLFALACFKPHLAAVLPIALLAGGHYRALVSFLVCGLLLVLGTMLYWGIEVWWAYLDSLFHVRGLLFAGNWEFSVHQSVYGFLRRLGLNHDHAQLLHFIVAGIWLVALALTWRSGRSLEARATLLILSALSLSPYLFSHDLLLLVVPTAFLLRRVSSSTPLCVVDLAIVLLWLASYHQTSWLAPPPLMYALLGAYFLQSREARAESSSQ